MKNENIKCNLEVECRDGTIQCKTICPVHFMEDRCCKFCLEINVCDKICGFIKINFKE